MSGLSAYTCTPRQIRRYIIRCMKARRVPFIKSSPAMGKSALVASIAAEYGLMLIDHRLSTSTPEDLSGLPKFITTVNGVEKASFVPFDFFPVEGDELPLLPGETERKFNAAGQCTNCYQGWLVFLDEFNSTAKAVQAAAYKLVLDKMTGQAKLHQNVVIVAAGNLATDRAIVNPIGTAMQSRLIHLKMVLDHTEFMEDVAFKYGWDSRIIAFLNYKKTALHDFRPDHNDETFCSPRTWEFMNDLIRGEEVKEEDAALYAGTITSGTAVEFITFTKVFNDLPTIKEITEDPLAAKLPADSATKYATITHLMEHANDDNFTPITEYVTRLGGDYRVLFFRGLMVQKPDLKKHLAFRRALVELSRYLHDDLAAAA
ncbi:hypothetical protein X766_15685 [Mesorhizobium sp. LSJC255A00]|uniref:hypothetical protein n=1 Tax=Mesorhizobium sp. LSJC255A00 TaxID=1287313 RepID=UPI0003CE3A08|nr:hypothetical protein [Mesorhizobium sp. LSJC255A00]ESX17520.1 hypothetical protein X766_15685 [Mesorhizobium sp. LSJC255A00]